MVAELGVVPADRVEGFGLPLLVAGGPVQVESLSGVVEGLAVATLPRPHQGEVAVGVGLPDLVAGLGRQVEAVLEVGVGVVVAAQLGVGAGQVAVSVGLCGRVG
jgi:hypothetical protein